MIKKTVCCLDKKTKEYMGFVLYTRQKTKLEPKKKDDNINNDISLYSRARLVNWLSK